MSHTHSRGLMGILMLTVTFILGMEVGERKTPKGTVTPGDPKTLLSLNECTKSRDHASCGSCHGDELWMDPRSKE